MFFDGMLPTGDGSATPAAVPDSLASDPVLGPLLQNDPTLAAALMGGAAGGATTQPVSLADALIGSAYDVTSAARDTNPFVGNMPAWVKSIDPLYRAGVKDNPDFDPYLGMLSQQGDERVYWGSGKTTKMVDPTGPSDYQAGGHDLAALDAPVPAHKEHVKADKTLTTTQAMNLPYTWDDAEVAAAMDKMKAAGLQVDSFDMGSNSLVNVWGALVNRAAMTYAMSEGDKKVTPWDVLDMYKSEAKAAGFDPGGFSGSKTQVARSVSDVSEGQAWSVIQQTLSNLLGRDPSDQEVRDFTYKMNNLAAANPSISKTITKYKNGEAVSSSTHSHTGFTAADMAQSAYEGAQADPEYGAYQSASTYFNAALSALGAIGG